jgi:hypothetical protein
MVSPTLALMISLRGFLVKLFRGFWMMLSASLSVLWGIRVVSL